MIQKLKNNEIQPKIIKRKKFDDEESNFVEEYPKWKQYVDECMEKMNINLYNSLLEKLLRDIKPSIESKWLGKKFLW